MRAALLRFFWEVPTRSWTNTLYHPLVLLPASMMRPQDSQGIRQKGSARLRRGLSVLGRCIHTQTLHGHMQTLNGHTWILERAHADIARPYAGIDEPYADIERPCADIALPYAGIERPYTDIERPYAHIERPYAVPAPIRV